MRGGIATLAMSFGLAAGAALAQPAPKSPPPPHFPWADQAAPMVAGVSLGESRGKVVAALGQPDATSAQPAAPGQFVLSYKARGINVVGSGKQGVFAVTLLSPAAGAVGAVHVGDNLPTVLRAWGRPRTVNGPYGIYDGKGFLAIVQFDPATMLVAHLGIASKSID